MNPGGEPERDDTGLPPVDIEIPDDARELDRDVQAYLRELRAERRRQRRRRLHVGLTRDGVILPLLACCLILALITGTLLTVFTATSDQLVTPPGSGTNTNRPTSTSPPASSSASASAGQTSAGAAAGPSLTRTTIRLPDVRLMVDTRPMLLPGMTGIMLVLIPPHCGCETAVSSLTRIGLSASAGTILVGTQGTIREARQLESQLSRLSPDIASNVAVTLDSQGALHKAVPAQGLTAVVISAPATAGGPQAVAYAGKLTSSDLTSSSSPLSVSLVKALEG